MESCTKLFIKRVKWIKCAVMHRAPPCPDMGEQEAGPAWQGCGPGGGADWDPPHTLHHALWRLLHEPTGAQACLDAACTMSVQGYSHTLVPDLHYGSS